VNRSGSLDGIRGIALASPIVVHLGLVGSDRGLWLAIGMFFTLSAFLVTSLALKEFDSTGRFELRKFWIRRLRRLMPASILVLAVTVVVAHLLDWPGMTAMRGDVLSALAWGANWEQLHGGGYWDAFSPSLTQHFWSLSFEEQVYVVFPMLVVGLVLLRRRVLGSWSLARLLALASMALIVFSWTCLWTIDDPSTLYLSTWTRLGEIGWGMALACWSHSASKRRLTDRQAGLALVTAMVLTAPMYALAAGDTVGGIRWGITLATPPTAFVIALLWRHPGSWVARGFSLAVPAWLGRRSYGIYLLHLPIIEFLSFRLGVERLPAWGMIVAVASTVFGAAVMFRWVEEPMRIGRRIPVDRRFVFALAAVVLVMIPSVFLATRPDARVLAIAPSAPPPSNMMNVRTPGDVEASSVGARLQSRKIDRGPTKTVLVVGDSTAWVTRGAVEAALRPKGYITFGVHMVGCPFGGDVRLKTSRMGGAVAIRELGEEKGCDQWWNELLPQWLESVRPDAVIVVGGYALAWEVDPAADDSWCRLGDGSGRCETWATERLRALTERIRDEAGDTRVVYTTAGRVDPWGPLDIPVESIDVLNGLIGEETRRSGAAMIDLGSWLTDNLHLTVDGTHLGPEGVEALTPWLANELPRVLER
jgi:peptidoglycan/LPS O-acetylase OafA/YrhL